MKKYIILPGAAILVLIACGKSASVGTRSHNADSTHIPTVEIDEQEKTLPFEIDSFHVYEKDTKCNDKDGECSYCDLYYEKIKTPLIPAHDSVNSYIDSLLLRELNRMSSDSYGYDLKKRAVEYIKSSISMLEPGDWCYYSYNSAMTCSVQEIITVNTGWGSYEGGAHGIFYREIANFFTNNGQMVSMDDVFTDMGAVNKMALANFKNQNEIGSDVDLMEAGWYVSDNDFYLNNNFHINADHIYWQYNPDEIGDGAPTVTIPMKDLQKYLKVKFTELEMK